MPTQKLYPYQNAFKIERNLTNTENIGSFDVSKKDFRMKVLRHPITIVIIAIYDIK